LVNRRPLRNYTVTPPGPAGQAPNCVRKLLGFSATCRVFFRTKVYHPTAAKHTHHCGFGAARVETCRRPYHTPKAQSVPTPPQALHTTHRCRAVVTGCLPIRTHALHTTHGSIPPGQVLVGMALGTGRSGLYPKWQMLTCTGAFGADISTHRRGAVVPGCCRAGAHELHTPHHQHTSRRGTWKCHLPL
jgi:hypothetical protein